MECDGIGRKGNLAVMEFMVRWPWVYYGGGTGVDAHLPRNNPNSSFSHAPARTENDPADMVPNAVRYIKLPRDYYPVEIRACLSGHTLRYIIIIFRIPTNIPTHNSAPPSPHLPGCTHRSNEI